MAPESESKKDKGVILMRKGRISGEHKMTNIQQKTPTLSSYTLVESWSSSSRGNRHRIYVYVYIYNTTIVNFTGQNVSMVTDPCQFQFTTPKATLSNHYSFLLLPSFAPSEFKEAFNLFDRKGSGNIAASSLGNLLRSIGQNPTQSEIQELVAQADPSCKRLIFFFFLSLQLKRKKTTTTGTSLQAYIA
jgi:hypothetical protein